MRWFSRPEARLAAAACVVTIVVFFLGGCATVRGDRFDPVDLEPYEHGERFLVGVLAFQNASGEPEMTALDASYPGAMISRLQEHNRYRLIEQERIRSLLEAQEFQFSGLVDSETAQEVGAMLGVEALCITTVERYSYTEERTTALIAWHDTQKVELGVNARIVSVGTGEVLASAEANVSRGRREWIAFGFLRRGEFVDPDVLVHESLRLAIEKLAADLSERAPRK